MIDPVAQLSGTLWVQAQLTGGYISTGKLVFMFLLTVPALALLPWVYQDTKQVRLPRELWSGMVLASYALGVLFWLLIPVYVVGLLFYLLLAGGGFLGYVLYRNSKVEPRFKVLTGDHIASIFQGKGGKKGKTQSGQVESRCKIYGADSSLVHPPATGGEDADPKKLRGFNLAQRILFDVVWRRASEADIVPHKNKATIRYTIDGVVSERPDMDVADSEALAQFIKSIAKLDTQERRRPQQGQISVEVTEGQQEEVSVRTAGTTSGQRIQIRCVQEVVHTDIDQLGMSEDVLSRVLQLSQEPGLIIVSGPAGSGVTSTLYSLIRTQDAFVHHLMTLERDPVIDLENITQNEYESPEQLPKALGSALRRDPDVVLIDRCKDPEAAELIRKASEDHVIFLGENAADSFTALAKWIKLCNSQPTAIDHLSAVTCQILVRKLCENCREPYKPDPALLAKANLPRQGIDRFYRPPTKPLTDEKGNEITCPVCQGSGYVGRTAVFELLEITPELRKLIHTGATLTQIKSVCRKNKMLYLQEQALRKVIQGTTSIQEVLRASQAKKNKQ
jgi:type II secretory ATPase GspE/PulE/Tfp pilus assembly ATPase PilB-like protein